MTTTICVWGGTGNGKSSTANLLLGSYFGVREMQTYNYGELFVPKQSVVEIFKTSANASSETQETSIKKSHWFGDQRFGEVLMIDTPGLGDPRGPAQDGLHIADMIRKLKQLERGVNLFLLIFNAEQPRFDDTLKELVRIFQKMFGDSIWNNVAVVFTKWYGDKRSKEKRKRVFGENPEAKKESMFKEHFRNEFKVNVNCFFFLDCDPGIEREDAADTIRNMISIRTIASAKDPFDCKQSQTTNRDVIVERDRARQAEQKAAEEERLKRIEQQRAAEAERLRRQEEQRAQEAERLRRQEEQRAKEAERLRRQEEQRAKEAIRREEEARQKWMNSIARIEQETKVEKSSPFEEFDREHRKTRWHKFSKRDTVWIIYATYENVHTYNRNKTVKNNGTEEYSNWVLVQTVKNKISERETSHHE